MWTIQTVVNGVWESVKVFDPGASDQVQEALVWARWINRIDRGKLYICYFAEGIEDWEDGVCIHVHVGEECDGRDLAGKISRDVKKHALKLQKVMA